MFKRLLQHPATLGFLASILAWYGRMAYATSRVEVLGNLPPQLLAGGCVTALWHQQISYVPLLRQKVPGQLLALMSVSRDGRFIRAAARPFNIGTIEGSSHRGAVAGMRNLLRAAKQGHTLFITPDGPRGPARIAKGGATEVASLTGLPLIPCAVWSSRAITFNSWDEVQLPLPFGRIVLTCGEPLATLTPQALTHALNQLTAQAQQAATQAGQR